MNRPLRIAQVAPPLERVPPDGSTAAPSVIVAQPVDGGSDGEGHEVTTLADGDSSIGGRHVPTRVPRAIRPAGLSRRFDPGYASWFIRHDPGGPGAVAWSST